MSQERPVIKNIKCPKCSGPAEEITTKEVKLLDFGGGPIPNVSTKKKVVCSRCGINNMAGSVEERYQDDG